MTDFFIFVIVSQVVQQSSCVMNYYIKASLGSSHTYLPRKRHTKENNKNSHKMNPKNKQTLRIQLMKGQQ